MPHETFLLCDLPSLASTTSFLDSATVATARNYLIPRVIPFPNKFLDNIDDCRDTLGGQAGRYLTNIADAALCMNKA